MYTTNKKLSAARQRIKNELTQLGWSEYTLYRTIKTDNLAYRPYLSPHIDNGIFWLENRLKKINTGEAYYALERYALQLSHLAWRCNLNNPNNRHPLDTLDAYCEARDMMLDGIDFDYTHGEGDPERDPEDYMGHITIIDWEHPENNTFEFVEGWLGAMDDNFKWDIILLINAIPVGAILLEPDDKDSTLASCQKALDLAQYQLDNDFQFPVYCHTLIISNGKQLLDGEPWRELKDFRSISSLSESLQPLEYLDKRIKLESSDL